MNKRSSVALLLYSDRPGGRDVTVEDKYKDLAAAFAEQGMIPDSVSYNDNLAAELSKSLLQYDAVLVWINPIEQGNNRKRLDAMLSEIASKGCIVSTLPEVILKMGTKEVLYTTRNMEWGGDIKMYENLQDFTDHFPASLASSGIRVLKQYRGNGGNGVFKIMSHQGNKLSIIHAAGGNDQTVTMDTLFTEFKPFFNDNGFLIDQPWNNNSANGMVRCYSSGSNVAGFGYQEINALADQPPSKRYYYSENCGLFADLKSIMENKWIPELKARLSIDDHLMPVIWDADFFINSIDSPTAVGKYELCEINVSCVSPFPPSAIKFMVDRVGSQLIK